MPCVLERLRLRRAAAGDQRERRRELARARRAAPRGAPAARSRGCRRPTGVAEQRARLVEQRAHLGAGHQREREERQAAAARHRLGERRAIRHARHRPLRDRIATLCARRAARGGASGWCAAAAARCCAIAARMPRTSCAAVGKRCASGFANAASWPSGMSGCANTSVAVTTIVSLPSIAAIAARTSSGSDDSRTSASWLSRTTPRAPATTRRRGVQADAALRPHRHRAARRPALEQHERGLVADATAGLAALRDQPIGPAAIAARASSSDVTCQHRAIPPSPRRARCHRRSRCALADRSIDSGVAKRTPKPVDREATTQARARRHRDRVRGRARRVRLHRTAPRRDLVSGRSNGTTCSRRPTARTSRPGSR